jgi:hypothetical protein
MSAVKEYLLFKVYVQFIKDFVNKSTIPLPVFTIKTSSCFKIYCGIFSGLSLVKKCLYRIKVLENVWRGIFRKQDVRISELDFRFGILYGVVKRGLVFENCSCIGLRISVGKNISHINFRNGLLVWENIWCIGSVS